MKLLSLVAAALVLAVWSGEVAAQCNQACPAPQVQQATYAAPVVVAQPLVVQSQLFVVPSAPTVQLQQFHVQPLAVQQVVQPVVQKVVQQRVVVQQQKVIQQQVVPRSRSLTIQRIRTR